jgi:hypothetical protein
VERLFKTLLDSIHHCAPTITILRIVASNSLNRITINSYLYNAQTKFPPATTAPPLSSYSSIFPNTMSPLTVQIDTRATTPRPAKPRIITATKATTL